MEEPWSYRNWIALAVCTVLFACGDNAPPALTHQSLAIGDRYVTINLGIKERRVDWMVIRDYDMADTDAPVADDRVEFDGNKVYVKLPDGSREPAHRSSLLYNLDDEGVEVAPIILFEADLSVIDAETHDSVRAMVDRLLEVSRRNERG